MNFSVLTPNPGLSPTKSSPCYINPNSLVIWLVPAKDLIYSLTSQKIAKMSLPSLPTFLKYLPACRVILCRRHGCTLTSQDVGVHLNIFHGYSSKRGNRISATARELGTAFEKSDAVVPMNGSARISDLKLHQGHECQVASDCQWLGVGEKAFQEHLQKQHGIDSRTGWAPHRQVALQCLFARSISPAYFVVGERGPIMTEIAPRDTGGEHDQPADRSKEAAEQLYVST